MNDQMIFKRYEIKYILTKQQQAALKTVLSEYMTADEHGKSTICSLYFDTPDFLLIRRSLEHPLYKEKLRLRSYGIADADSTVFVELKKKYDSVVYKRRISMSEDAADKYLSEHAPSTGTQISHEIDYCMNLYRDLSPKVLLTYEREAFYGKYDHELRITFDEQILWRDFDLNLTSGIYGNPILRDDQVLMEVKTTGAIPMWLVRFLSANQIYKTSFSKYGTAYIQMTGGNSHYA